MPVFVLDPEQLVFPDPRYAEDDGLLAIGGNLSVKRLLLAYRHGIFPWFNEDQPILWWCPKERYIIRPEAIHISKSMRRYMRHHEIRIQTDRDFYDTMHRCRLKREHAEGTWITDDMERAYTTLHSTGYAMSVESYVDGELAGGLYGVHFGRCFFGESMFTDIENGSKLALIGLAHILEHTGHKFIDCQFHTDHLESMGGEYISYEEYMELIREGLEDP